MTAMSNAAKMDLQPALQRFGLNSFRKGQREVIDHIIAGNDCLCVMPTGGGKSLCYQLPSIVRKGLTIVVSPLIALMKDQVDTLVKRGISATLINRRLDWSVSQADTTIFSTWPPNDCAIRIFWMRFGPLRCNF